MKIMNKFRCLEACDIVNRDLIDYSSNRMLGFDIIKKQYGLL